MPVKVVDASALAAVLFGEPEAEIVTARLVDAWLLAPAILEFEMGNVGLKKIRRHLAQDAAIREVLDVYSEMMIETVAIDLTAVVTLAAESGLSVYDASYLWLAQYMGAELVTLDRRLAVVAAPRLNN